MTRKEMENIRVLQNRLNADYKQAKRIEMETIREGEAVIGLILTRDLGISVVEAEMMLEPYIKGELK